jgi:hypothetical protein
MICCKDTHLGCWAAAGKGLLRPIFETAPTRQGAIDNFATEFAQQQREEAHLAAQHDANSDEYGIETYEESHG